MSLIITICLNNFIARSFMKYSNFKVKYMRIIIILFSSFLSVTLYAQGCIRGDRPSQPHYVCFDGRTLDPTVSGFVWNAKRGCFISSVPCCAYNATHYAYYANSLKIGSAYARCRHDYPFRLGEMQTH